MLWETEEIIETTAAQNVFIDGLIIYMPVYYYCIIGRRIWKLIGRRGRCLVVGAFNFLMQR